jgi:hypothetical protein
MRSFTICTLYSMTQEMYIDFVLKSEGKRLLDRLRHRWEKKNKLDLEETLERLWSEYILLRTDR